MGLLSFLRAKVLIEMKNDCGERSTEMSEY